MADSKVVGRLTEDAYVFPKKDGAKTTGINLTIARERALPDANGERQADYPQFTWFATDKQVDFAKDYLKKGAMIQVESDFHTAILPDKNDTSKNVGVVSNVIVPNGIKMLVFAKK